MNLTEWKYVILRHNIVPGGETTPGMVAQEPMYQEHPILFPKSLTHYSMAEAVMESNDFTVDKCARADVVAAGFCRYDEIEGWRCYGESTSLRDCGYENYRARAQDSDVIGSLSLTHGLVHLEDV